MQTLSALDSIKAAITVARGMKSLDDRTKINEAVIDIQDNLLRAQSAMFEMQEATEALKAEVRSLQALRADKYELAEPEVGGRIWEGRWAYLDKESGVYYCPFCFVEGKLVPAQFYGNLAKTCGRCSGDLGYATGTQHSTGADLPI